MRYRFMSIINIVIYKYDVILLFCYGEYGEYVYRHFYSKY